MLKFSILFILRNDIKIFIEIKHVNLIIDNNLLKYEYRKVNSNITS